MGFQVQCFPLYSVLAALNHPTIDYFSLDIEGAELMVLKTLPWDRVDIKLLGVEWPHLGSVFDGDESELIKLAQDAGYDRHKKVGNDAFFWKSKGDKTRKKLSKDQ